MYPDFEESREEPEKRSTGNEPYAYTFGILGYRKCSSEYTAEIAPPNRSMSGGDWTDFEWIVVVGGLGCVWFAWTIGANDLSTGETILQHAWHCARSSPA